ncbi:MAG: dihydroorotase [Chthonomonadaceae bacterium]|nr:dihydroorotase [Chthonomonadaceae bacterium]
MAPGGYVIKGGTIVTSKETFEADLRVENGVITEIGFNLEGESSLCVKGLHVLPGVIDTQVHFREPGLTHKEDLESGSRAAVFGGVTTFFDEPNVIPPTIDSQALANKVKSATGRSWANFCFWMGAAQSNLDELAKLEQLPGCPGIGEVFMGSSTGNLLVPDDGSLRIVLKNGSRRVAIHAEDEYRLEERRSLLSELPHVREHPCLRDVESSVLATRRIIGLSAETGRPIHVLHVSTQEETSLLAEAKSQIALTCEITPQHLTFTAEDYESLGSQIQMNTPIRESRHREALWKAVEAGVFDVVGSDHAPHTREEKAAPYPGSPSGIPGVQTLLPVMLDFVSKGQIGLNQLVQMTSESPARLFGVEGRGKIATGYAADLAIVDLSSTFEVTPDWLQSKCGWSPWMGRKLRGRPVHTVVNGKFALREEAAGEPAAGQLVQFDWKTEPAVD